MSKSVDIRARIAEAKAKAAEATAEYEATKAAHDDATRAKMKELAEQDLDTPSREAGPRLVIVGSESDSPLGEIDGSGLHYGDRRGSLTRGGRALIKLLGGGFGNARFHIVAGDVTLVNCQIERTNAGDGFDVTHSFSYERSTRSTNS